MFTGIVEAVGTVRRAGAHALTLEAPTLVPRLNRGDSVAVNGVCLTASRLEERHFEADVSAETLSRTNLGALRPGSPVNLETALTLGKPLGGHLLTGHVDCTGRLAEIRRSPESWVVHVTFPPGFARYVVDRGSIAVDGVSLTVAAVEGDGVRLALIPHTLGETTLSGTRPGTVVNLEFDILGKYVARCLDLRAGGGPSSETADDRALSLDSLRRMGF
ncbi:MAG: riboflavin synthase [Acidobacteria bacterium]|nr:riboflavin synthase [Acidobacteriota bacterium]